MNKFLVIAAALAVAASITVAVASPATTSNHAALAPSVSASSPQSGELHLTKSCPPNVPAIIGAVSYCTITASNLDAIPVGTTIDYASADGVPIVGWVDSNVVLAAGHRNAAFGHVDLNLSTHHGVVTFWGGTGDLKWFRAGPIAVACGPVNGVPTCSWDGPYTFVPYSP